MRPDDYDMSILFLHCLGPSGCYRYTDDLLKLSTSCHHTSMAVDPRLQAISTPLNKSQWQYRLLNHPDTDFACYLLKGMEFGFHTGVQEGISLQAGKSNMQSARDHPQIIEDYLQKELSQG